MTMLVYENGKEVMMLDNHIPRGFAVKKIVEGKGGARFVYVRESYPSRVIHFLVKLTDKITGFEESL